MSTRFPIWERPVQPSWSWINSSHFAPKTHKFTCWCLAISAIYVEWKSPQINLKRNKLNIAEHCKEAPGYYVNYLACKRVITLNSIRQNSAACHTFLILDSTHTAILNHSQNLQLKEKRDRSIYFIHFFLNSAATK